MDKVTGVPSQVQYLTENETLNNSIKATKLSVKTRNEGGADEVVVPITWSGPYFHRCTESGAAERLLYCKKGKYHHEQLHYIDLRITYVGPKVL